MDENDAHKVLPRKALILRALRDVRVVPSAEL